MRVLILGGGGMLGHKLWQACRDRFETWVTVRGRASEYRRFGIFDERRMLGGVDAADFDSIVRAVAAVQPDAVVNCVGIIKQLAAAKDPVASLTVNSLFPHRAAALCRAAHARFVHISTDCVFSGRRGGYAEDDEPDAVDLYGRSKQLGEVGAPALTLRTSMIGRELTTSSGLVEWFLGNRGGTVDGYTKARFSGLTTLSLAGVIADILEHHPELGGLYHVAADPISKHDLLLLLRDRLALSIDVRPRHDLVIDRTLDGTRLRAAARLDITDWPTMIGRMADDPTPYDDWRSSRVA